MLHDICISRFSDEWSTAGQDVLVWPQWQWSWRELALVKYRIGYYLSWMGHNMGPTDKCSRWKLWLPYVSRNCMAWLLQPHDIPIHMWDINRLHSRVWLWDIAMETLIWKWNVASELFPNLRSSVYLQTYRMIRLILHWTSAWVFGKHYIGRCFKNVFLCYI